MIVGAKPAIPGIAAIVISDFFFRYLLFKSLIIFILEFLNLLLTFANTLSLVMRKKLGLYFLI